MRYLDLIVELIKTGNIPKDRGISILLDTRYQKGLELEEINDIIDDLRKNKGETK